MSIKQLQDFIGKVNIAEDLDESTLTAIGSRVKRQYDEDLDSMGPWKKSVDNGIDLMKQEWEAKSTPWEGASNYKDPLPIQASVQFGDRAKLELLRGKELITSEVIGKDPEGTKEAASDRVTTMMNFQINHDMGDWRGAQGRMFYNLPTTGNVFKKMTWDPDERKAESVIIQYPDFVVNQATRSMDECRSFSQDMDMSSNDIEYRVRTKKWLELKETTPDTEIDKKGDKGSNEEQKVEDSADNPEKFIEQQTFFDIDEDGYEEPYIVTFRHKDSQVVRIVARFDERSIFVRVNDRVIPLNDALQVRQSEQMEEFGGQETLNLVGLPQEVTEIDPDSLELVKIVPFQQITKYGFIPALDGTFLDWGYSHVLGAITQSLNASTNQLTDRATLNNVGGGLLSKEFRKEMGPTRLRIGEWKKTNVPADKLQQGVFPNPTGEPSPTLLTLNEKTRERGQSILATIDVSGQITAQTAPTTALAIIQEGMIPTSALFQSILDSETNEFKILFRLNQRTLDDQEYQEVLDEPAKVQDDFNTKRMDISPTASAEMSTKMQRLQVAEIQLAQFDRVLQAGGNPLPILEDYFDAVGSQIQDRIFPEEGSMTEQEKQQLDQMKQAQEQANQMMELQLQILSREQDRLDEDSAEDRRKTAKEIEKLQADIVETMMSAALSGEKAETEALNNKISKYTADVQILVDRLAIGAINDRNIAASPALQAPAGQLRAVQ